MTALPYKKILVIRANAVSDFRMNLAGRYLERAGYDVELITQVPFYKASQVDIVICCRPGISMVEFLKVCIIAGKKVVIDLDDDFNSIPRHNPAYQYTGAGHPTYLPELKRILLNPAILATYASEELNNRYKVNGIVIPNYFDEENPFWDVPKRSKEGEVHIGFSGTSTHREDFNIIEPVVHRILSDYPNVKLVVSNDDQIYSRFFEVPEERKVFLPGVSYDDYPLIFSYIDLLLVPLRDTYFNRAKSDVKLVEAGHGKTAWIASDLPVYRAWGAGGLIAKDGEWEAAIRSLLDNPDRIKELAKEGEAKTWERASIVVCRKWLEIVERLCQ